MCRMESRLSRLIGICVSVLIICTTLAEANDTYVLTSLISTWDNACIGNGPAVIDGIQFYPMKFPPNLLSTIGSGRAWIGYYQRFGYFNLLGCLPVIAESSLSLIDNTPGRCATACGSCNYIGLEDDICHCLKETNIGTSHFKNAVTCSMKMCNGTHFFCGTRGQMWVYGVNNVNTARLDQLGTTSNNENRCLSAHYWPYPAGVSWTFSSCMDHHKSLCEFNNTFLDYNTYVLSSPAPWDEAVKHCFNESETPARFEYNYWRRYNVQNFDEAWTAYIRDEIIQKKESESIPEGRIRCLSLSVSEGKPEVHFENCEDNLPAVCLAGITPRTTTTTTTTTAATTTSIITSIRSTTSAEIKTPTSSEPQLISGKSAVSSTSGSTQELSANKAAIVNNAEANDMYKLTSLNSTWDNACFDNGPAVIDGIQFYPMKFPPNLSSTIGAGRAWIGYYQRFGYFNLLGCSSINAESSLILIGNTPGRCATACGSCNFIGLEDDICHCLNVTDIGTSHFKNVVTCSMKMCKGTHFFCGTRGQMWVYGVNNATRNTAHFDQLAKTSNNDNRCLSAKFDAWSGGAVWKFSSCLGHHKSLCELNNTVIDYVTYGLSSLTSWDESVLNCFNKSETPARFDYDHWRRYHIENFNEAWTAYIRDEVIQKKGLESIREGRIRCVSLSVSDGKPELHLENCEDNLPAVCLAGIMPRTTTTTTTTTAATTTRLIASIRSTTSAEIKTPTSSTSIGINQVVRHRNFQQINQQL